MPNLCDACFSLGCIACRYDALKKLIYQLEKKKHNLDSQYHDIESNEHSALISQDIGDTDVLFKPALDGELQKIVYFYEQQEKDFLQEVTELEKMVEQQEVAGLAGHPYLEEVGDDDEEDDDDDDEEHFDPQSPIHSREPTGSTSRRRRRRRTLSSAGFGRVPELHGRMVYSFHAAMNVLNELQDPQVRTLRTGTVFPQAAKKQMTLKQVSFRSVHRRSQASPPCQQCEGSRVNYRSWEIAC